MKTARLFRFALLLLSPWAAAQTPGARDLSRDDGVLEALQNDAAQMQDVHTPAALVGNGRGEGIVSGNMRLGFVNFRRIMGSIPQLASLHERLTQEFLGQRQMLEAAERELADLERRAVGSAGGSEFEQLAQQLIVKRREVARLNASFQDDYNVRRNEELAKLQRQVLDEIVGLAKERGFDIILNDNGVLYVSEEADLTQQVIERLLSATGGRKTGE